MFDFIFSFFTLALFIVTLGYAAMCERL